MLKSMRDGFRHLKWILFLVIFVFVMLVFVDWGAQGTGGSAGASGAFAARVNGETISLDDYGRALYYAEQQYEQIYGQPLTEEMRETIGIRRQVLQSLVNQRILMQEADRMSLKATPQEVRRRILGIPALSPNGQFVGAELYERFVTLNLGYRSAADFEDDLVQDLTLAKMDSVFSSIVVVAPQRAESEYRQRTESTSIRYVLLPSGDVMGDVSVSPDEVSAFYRENPDRYSHAEQRRVKYLLADVTRLRSQIQVSEEELRQEYESSKEDFSAGEMARVQHILLRTAAGDAPEVAEEKRLLATNLVGQLRDGASFESLAKEHSEDPGSAAQGGDLGFFGRGDMVPPFEQAAFGQAIGEIGEPVQSQFGWHIVKVLERKSEGYRSFDDVRSDLMRKVIEQRAADAARDAIATIRAQIEEGAKKTEQELRAFANDVVSYNDASWFGRNDVVTGLGRLPELNDWTFGAEKDVVGGIIQTSRGPILPHLIGTRPAGVTPLEEIRGRVQADARQQKAREVARDRIAAAWNEGMTIDELATAMSLEVREARITPNSPVSGLPGDASLLSEAARQGEEGVVGGPVVIEAGAVQFEVTEQSRFDSEKFAQEKEQILREIRRSEAQRLRASLVDGLRKQAKIELNESLLQTSSRG